MTRCRPLSACVSLACGRSLNCKNSDTSQWFKKLSDGCSPPPQSAENRSLAGQFLDKNIPISTLTRRRPSMTTSKFADRLNISNRINQACLSASRFPLSFVTEKKSWSPIFKPLPFKVSKPCRSKQVHLAPGQNAFTVVGLPDKSVAESRERVRAALSAVENWPCPMTHYDNSRPPICRKRQPL